MLDFAAELANHEAYAYGIAHRRYDNLQDAQDAVQAAMLKAWQARDTDVEHFKRWFGRIVT